MTVIAFTLNLIIVWLVLRWASVIGRVLGDGGSRAIAKVFNLVLAAIAVTFIRQWLMAAMAR